MSNWSLEIYNLQDVTPAWSQDVYTDGLAVRFPRSTRKLPSQIKSNNQYVKLVDGSEAIIHPSTAYIKTDITFSISPLRVTDEMMTKFNGYVEDDIGIKITTHTDEVIKGYIKSINKVYEMTGSTQLYSVDVIIRRIDVDSSGNVY